MADSIKIGSLDISSFKVGSDDCKVYLGSTLLYSGGTTPPTPPVFQGKWKATYTGGTTSSADCDASSAITSGEIALTDLESVEIGDCVTSLNINAFNDYNTLSSVTLSNSVSIIGVQAFRNTSLINVELSDNVVSIGISAFYGCASLTSVTIGDGVATIDQSAFQNCTSLQEVYIGSGITNIGEQCFTFDNNITSITIMATTPPTLGANPFYGSSCPIYVQSESVDTYKAASGWSSYASRIQAIPNS